uniref:Uncharacterized protein n=1 Tax=Cacopsylla melanoneura TaxID=428564 RepID=A0A8D8T7R9_9HEMI
MEKFNILTLEQRRNIADIIFLSKLLNLGINCPSLFNEINRRTNHNNLRNRNIFTLKTYTRIETENNPMNRCFKLANRLANPPFNINIDLIPTMSMKNKLLLMNEKQHQDLAISLV